METIGNSFITEDWGLLPYDQAFDRQKAYVAARLNGSQTDRLVIVEHPAVVTIGRSGNEADLRLPQGLLKQKGVDLHYIDRGGRATFHGPGQLVAYPIIKLKDKDVHHYVDSLLETLAFVLRSYGLEPVFKEGSPGIWVAGKKIASVGIALKRWVCYHGVALNVNPDLSMFEWIVPCGHAGEVMTSMQAELGRALDMAEVKTAFVDAFYERFALHQNQKLKAYR